VAEIGVQPTICFLDPFGVKGIELESVAKIINRNAATDLWIRFDPQTVRRLDGFFDSGDATANKKFGILPEIYGIKDREDLHSHLAGSTPDDRLNNALILYMERLVGLYKKARGAGFVGAYAIRSLSEQVKYHLVFATGHPRGIILTSEIVCGMEETYQVELQGFREAQTRQLALFSSEPTQEEIFAQKVTSLKLDIQQYSQGKILTRDQVYLGILHKWFGRIKSAHLNKALHELQSEAIILKVEGRISDPHSKLYFKNSG
jgi:hypothetical protein